MALSTLEEPEHFITLIVFVWKKNVIYT